MVAFMHILLLAVTASAASILHRDAIPLIDIINNEIVPQLNTLQNDVNAFPGSGLNGSITLDNDEDKLSSILDNATSLAHAAGTFGILDTLHVATALAPAVTGSTAYLASLATKVTASTLLAEHPSFSTTFKFRKLDGPTSPIL